jgi:hypothetical protein
MNGGIMHGFLSSRLMMFVILSASILGDAEIAVAQSSCISHRLIRSGNEIAIEATNKCKKPILANICAMISDRIGEERSGKEVKASSTVRFSYFAPEKSRIDYTLAECQSGLSTRQDICVPQCPPPHPNTYTIRCGYRNGTEAFIYENFKVEADTREQATQIGQAQCAAKDRSPPVPR